MPKTSKEQLLGLSFRWPPEVASWLKDRAEAEKQSLNAATETLLRDHMNWYGLPAPMVAVLQEDAKAAKASTQRDYILHLLVRRYDELKEAQLRAELSKKDEGKKSSR